MSEESAAEQQMLPPAARALIARAAGADLRAHAALDGAIRELGAQVQHRIDDRTRAAIERQIDAFVNAADAELRQRATRLLLARRLPLVAEALNAPAPPAIDRLAAAGLLADAELVGETLARAQLRHLADAMPPVDARTDGDERPSLLVRLSRSPDRLVAASAAGVLAGESRRTAAGEVTTSAGDPLPLPLHTRLLWRVAAALVARTPLSGEEAQALERALAEAVQRGLAALSDGDRLEASAMRLAAAIDCGPDELQPLIEEALDDRRPLLFAALLAHGLDMPIDAARELLTDPDGERLWLALRALALPRDAIARIGYRIAEADPRRDVEAFADALDTVMAIAPDVAARAVAVLRLPLEYRRALACLAR